MQGCNVLHPMGWDAFGLPAENYAIKTGIHPRVTTEKAIANFRRQIDSIGFAYDWDREVNTTDPQYIKWTQWIFLQLYKQGPGLRGHRAHQLVPVVQDRPGQRRSHAGVLRALWQRGRAQRHAPVVAAHHPLRGSVVGGLGGPGLARVYLGHAAQLDRPLRRGRGHLQGRRVRRSAGKRRDQSLHYPARYLVRRDLHGAVPGTPAGRQLDHAGAAGRRARVPDRRAPQERPGTHRSGQRKDGRVHRSLRHQSGQPREDSGLDRGLRSFQLWHRRDHGGAGARSARLRIRQQVQSAHSSRGAARRRPRPRARPGVRRRRHRDQLGRSRRSAHARRPRPR